MCASPSESTWLQDALWEQGKPTETVRRSAEENPDHGMFCTVDVTLTHATLFKR